MVKTKNELKSPKKGLGLLKKNLGKIINKENTNGSTGGNIRVIVRVRPPNQREFGDNFRDVIKILDNQSLIFDPKEEEEPFYYRGIQQRNWDITKRANKNINFTFDRVFGYDACNNDIFEDSTKALIGNLMTGYNCSVFVYGATGAGKTHTMIGSQNDPGITFKTVSKLFEQKDELSSEREFEIAMSYLEVYNENVQDLLNPGLALQLRENGKYGVCVPGLQVHPITDSIKLFELLEKGNRNRTQHPTDANAESSRSHAVFQVYLKMKIKTTGELQSAKLSMIDLAGSEKGAATGFTGARFTEGANINRSLLALGNCINSLADGHRHVPYRDSKLTRLLKDSLGGNCRTIMITNISPSSFSYEDTYNTLKYAMRAKNIKSNIIKNIINTEGNLNYYVKLTDELRKENENLKLQITTLSEKKCNCEANLEKKEFSSSIVNEELQNKLKSFYAEKKELLEKLHQFESVNDLVLKRKNLKEECNSRISSICTNSAERKDGHRRLDNAVERLDRQDTNFKMNITNFKEQGQELELKIKELLQQTPQLNPIAEVEEAKISCIKANNELQHLEKVNVFNTKELQMKDQLIEKMAEVLKPCFMQLKGHGYVTEALDANYQKIVQQIKGIRSVTWNNDATNTDDMADTISTTTNDDVLNITVTLDENTKTNNFNETFNVETILRKTPNGKIRTDLSTKVNKTPFKEITSVSSTLNRNAAQEKRVPVSAKHIMTKLYKVSPSRNRKGSVQSPRNKENKLVRCATLGRPRFNMRKDKEPLIQKGRSTATSQFVSSSRK